MMDDFSGGLNTTTPPKKLDPRFSPEMKNVFVHRVPGSILKRNGFSQVGSTTNLTDIRFGFTFYKENGSVEYIVSDGSRVLSTEDFTTYVTISSGLSNTVGLSAVQAQNKVWFTNGSDAVFTWDGTVRRVLDGTNGAANVPRFRYVAFWQERIWGLNTSAKASSLDFSAVKTTASEILAPDDPRAWDGNHRFQVGEGDGQNGTALWVQNGRLYIGKERSVWRMLGNSDTSYQPDVVLKDVGVISHDSVVLLDNDAYFKGNNNSVYEFNGQSSRRITDGIVSNISDVNDATNKTLTNTWETRSDFLRGSLLAGSTVEIVNLLTVVSTAAVFTTNNIAPQANPFPINSVTTTTNFLNFTIWGTSIPYNYAGFLKLVDTNLVCGPPCIAPPTVTMTILNRRTGISEIYTKTGFNCGGGLGCTFVYSGTSTYFTGQDTLVSSFAWKLDYSGIPAQDVAPSGFNWDVYFNANSTGNYVSDIATMTMVSSWGNLDSSYNQNTGNVRFFYHTGPTVAITSTRTWIPISPGNRISAPASETFIQWAASMTMISTTSIPPNILSVSISHLEGGANRDRPFGISWNREYWLSVATGTNDTSIQYVKAWRTSPNPDAWNPLFNQDIRCFFKDGDRVLYGGSSKGPVIYRLDFGDDDNGLAIDSYYDTPDFNFGNKFMDKTFYEAWIEVVPESGANFSLGVSSNSASNYFMSKSMNGTAATKRLYFKNTGGTPKNTWRFRFKNSELDKRLQIDNASILWKETNVRSE